ncbi:MAG: chromosomal replication initiator protein DnaA [Candidatus Woesebacteria bacterium]|jgi:chromosomal replication initiator protein
MNNALWQTVLGEIELTVSRASFMTWFKNTELIEQNAEYATISVPNIFAKQQLEVKFSNQILETLNKNGASVSKVRYTIQSATKKKGAEAKNSNVATVGQVATKIVNTSNSGNSASTKQDTSLNPRYTFETFIVGSSNELAYTACQAVANSPGTKYNPLFLYGGVGLGKTHLIQAVGNGIAANDPSARILYISSETFVSDFLDSIRFKKNGFSDRYRNVDVLIIDDMQFIAGKEKTQEEFFHTFNALHQANKQIIISSDRPPKSIPTLTDRLRSRFEWGMTIDIQMPDFETRCAILQTKANCAGFTLDKETVDYLATHIQTNIRELEGALNQLLAFCEMRGIDPDLQTAAGLLGNVRTTRPHHLTCKQVIDKTAKHFQVDAGDILSAKRDKHIVVPRQIAMYLLRSELHLSFPKIAKELGRKDHTTAIHSVEKIEKALKLDYIIRQQVTEIRDKLYV